MSPRPKKLRLLRWLPRSLVLTTAPAEDRTLYLTFDDGPHPEYTPRVLDLLAANDARASFFLIGQAVEHEPRIVERIVSEGHLIGNHSYNHPRFTKLPWSEQSAQIERTDRVLEAFDQRTQHRFRPPSGHFTVAMLASFALRRRNITYWSYDSMDYLRKPAEALIDVLRADPPRPGDVVLMHDDNEATVRMLEQLLPEWRSQGFAMRSLPSEALR
jgi:peptidoglycan/xylan/chitin deacetylase (PgdA/CDA1 family)